MPLFRRRSSIDYEELAKAVAPFVAQAAANSAGGILPQPGGSSSSPFAQTGGGQIQSPLPRPAESFGSLFGPGVPLIPDPLDPVGRNGRTPPRRSEYLVAWNLQLVDRQVPWTMLRWLAEDCDVVNRCIQLTQDEQCGLDWGWTFAPQLLQQIMADTGETNSAKAAAVAREQYGSHLLATQRFFERPDGDMNQSFADWLQALLWDHLVYDGVAIYPSRNLDGSLRNLELIDASTIKLYRDNRGRVPQPPAPAYGQILYGFPRGEFQHTDDEADDEFALDQLAYYIRRPRNTSVYGYPQVEEVMALATTYLGRQAWMRAEYTTGVTPKMLVNVDDNGQWTPEQWAQYELNFNDRLTGQIERRQMAFFMRQGAKAEWAPQIDEHYKSDYDNWLIAQIGSRFGRPASMLGVQAKAGLSGGKQQEGEADLSDIYSGKALSRWVVTLLNDLAVRFLGVPPGIITASFNGGGTNEDELQRAQADAQLVAAGLYSRNERRAKRGDPLSSEPEADQLAITTSAGVTFLAGQLKVQEEAMAASAQPGMPTTPGAPAAQPDKPAEPSEPSEPAEKAQAVKAAGLVVKADDTGRVLMVQRAIDNQNQRAAGQWEWPGGKLAAGDAPFDAAQREWEEEVGIPLPKGKTIGQWEANDGRYVGFVYVIASESLIELNDARGLDGAGDSEVENVAWWEPSDIVGNNAVRVEVQSSDWALIGSAKKAVKGGGLPKALADRKAAQAAIAAHYQPMLADGYRKAFPGIVQAARNTASGFRTNATKAPTDEDAAARVVARFKAARNADTAALAAAVKAMHTDAWVAGTRAALQGPGGDSIAASLDDVSVDAPDDWVPGWAVDNPVESPPQGLAALTPDKVAAALAAGLLDRVGATLAAAMTSGQPASVVGTMVRATVGSDTGPELAAVTETATAAEASAQAAYQAAGFDRWRWVTEPEACDVCVAKDGQTYGADDDPPPAHPRCGCGSEPVADDEET